MLQWTEGAAAADAVYILLTGDYYEFKGYFGRPDALAPGASLVHHPIPPEVWKAATLSSAGGQLTLAVTIASGSTAYGPIEQTWNIAHGPLKGTVYYQSYGTDLAKNFTGAIGGDGTFGGAVLAITGDSIEPTLVAGSDGGKAECRVCHTVAVEGNKLFVQHGDDYNASSAYDLGAGFTETAMGAANDYKFGWAGLYPDGSMAMNNGVPFATRVLPQTVMLDTATGAEIPSTGLAGFVTHAGFPAFSPDGKHVAFMLYAGPGNVDIGIGDGSQLVAMDFDRKTMTFSNPRLLYRSPAGKSPGWPSFLPTNDAVIFSVHKRLNDYNEYMMTRYGGTAELWWSDLATGNARPLDRANGDEGGAIYIPSGPNNHIDDTILNYEPTVNPVVSGGYAWVIFMSRRMYGNVATVDPWWSDPRDYDHTVHVTPKKLWLAAIDVSNLDPATNADPSFSAFYLPAQELMAGNTRGYWAVDPCKEDGEPCEAGVECCNGFWQADPDTGGLICTENSNACSEEYEKCEEDSDCCDFLDGMKCINGFCATPVSPPIE